MSLKASIGEPTSPGCCEKDAIENARIERQREKLSNVDPSAKRWNVYNSTTQRGLSSTSNEISDSGNFVTVVAFADTVFRDRLGSDSEGKTGAA